MDSTMIAYACVLLAGVFIASLSQVMLKKAAMRSHESAIKEYMNPLVIFAYVLFLGTTFLSIIAYRGIPLSMGPILEATSYIYVTIFGVCIFKEKITKKKVVALGLILLGIAIFSFFT